MTSREKILARIKENQPSGIPLPALPHFVQEHGDLVQKFIRTLGNIGGTAIEVSSGYEIRTYIDDRFPGPKRMINLVPEAGEVMLPGDFEKDPHLLENVSLAVFKGHFGVAENGAVWITDERFGDRALPFICEHIVVVIHAEDILPSLQEAYKRIGSSQYDFGVFIAGPSKTADIEQLLVLGAHGPKSMTLFVLRS